MSNSPQLTDKKKSVVRRFLEENKGPEWVKSFDKAKDKYGWIKLNWDELEQSEAWVEKFDSLSDFTKSKKQQLESTYKEYPHLGNLSQYRINNILSKSDFTEDEMRDYYEYRAAKDAAEAENDQKKVQEATDRYMKLQRSRDDSYFNTPIANEYARKAYIEGTGDEVKQELLGKGASLFDWLPFVSLASPAMRQSQRIMAGEEPAEVGIPSKKTAIDYGSALVPDIIERPGKLALGALKSAVNKIAGRGAAREIPVLTQVENRMNRGSIEAQNARNDILFGKFNLEDLDDAQIRELYNEVSDPKIKADIEAYWRSRREYNQAQMIRESAEGNPQLTQTAEENLERARSEMERAATDYNLNARGREGELRIKGELADKPVFSEGVFDERYADAPLSTINEYVKAQDKGGAGAALVEKALKFGSPKVIRSTAGGRLWNWDMIDPEADVKNYDPQRDIDLVIKTQSKNWKIDEKPADYDENPLVREAYDQWRVSPFKEWKYKSWRTE